MQQRIIQTENWIAHGVLALIDINNGSSTLTLEEDTYDVIIKGEVADGVYVVSQEAIGEQYESPMVEASNLVAYAKSIDLETKAQFLTSDGTVCDECHHKTLNITVFIPDPKNTIEITESLRKIFKESGKDMILLDHLRNKGIL